MAADTDTTEALAVLLANDHLDVLDSLDELRGINTRLIAQAALDVIATKRGATPESRPRLRALQKAAWKVLV